MTDFPDIKLKSVVNFPGNIIGGTGIDATKHNGAVTVDMDWSEFGTISAIPTSPTSNVLTYDTATNAYVMVPSHLMGGAVAGIADAPIDGTLYGRESAGWVHAVPEAPTDGQTYSRQSSAWVPFTNSFIQGGSGAVTRVMQDKVRETVSIIDYGARPDFAEVTRAISITAGSANLLVSAGVFTAGDIGKSITVPGAGSAGGGLVTTIAGFADAQHITLAANAGTTISAVSKTVSYGTDNSAAILAAITYSVLIGAEVRITNGNYGCWSRIIYSFPSARGSVKLIGNGRNNSSLCWPNPNGGLQLNYFSLYNTSHVRDLAFMTSQPPASAGIGLLLSFYNQVSNIVYDFSDVASCTFKGNDSFPGGVSFWNIGISVVSVCGVNFDALNFFGGARNGVGISLQGHAEQAATNAAGTGSTLSFASLPPGVKIGMRVFNVTTPASPIAWLQINSIAGNTVTLTGPATGVASGDSILFQYEALVYNITKSNFIGLDTAVVYGTAAQGLMISQTVMQVCGFGIVVPASAVGIVQLFLTNNWFAVDKESVLGNAEITDVNISNNGFAVYNNTGDPDILFVKATRLVITGNDFVDEHAGGTTPTAISVLATGAGGIINSNSFYGFNNAVVLNTGTSFVKVTLNTYFNTATPIANFGTSNTITPL